MIEPIIQEETRETPAVETRPASRNALSRRHSPTADLIKAHVALMEREVILPRQADLFRLVQHHYHSLQSWHDQHTGWRIQRSSTVIRLVRHVSATTPGYLYERLREPRDFACLTWTLWYAENRQLSGRGNDQQFLLSQLAEQIQEQSAYDGNAAAFDFRRPADRYSIQRALHYLQDLGGLQLVDGQTREWVEQAANADVLYEFTDVARSLVGALSPQVVESAAERLADSSALLQPTKLQEAAGTPPLVRAWRALILGPAFFRFDDPPAFDELLRHLDGIAIELMDTFGWLLDIRRDYACIVRASGMSTGPVTALTQFGSNDQIALLLCAAMREQVTAGAWPGPDAYGCLHVMTEDMSELFYAVRERYGESWGNEARNKSARSLLNDVYRKMRQVGILRGPDEAGNVLILPIAARYSATYDQSERSATLRSRAKAKVAKKAMAAELPGLDEA
jgi:uncharacterized protein (TIGR02678 family)